MHLRSHTLLLAGIPAFAALAALPAAAAGPPAKSALPRRPPPLISITAIQPDNRDAETRLARFIAALQRDRRLEASNLLSSRVTLPERRALIASQWLRRDERGRKDFTQILFFPDLQIRTSHFERAKAELFVVVRPKGPPRQYMWNPPKLDPRSRRKKGVSGFLRVPMIKEGSEWRIDLHPDHSR